MSCYEAASGALGSEMFVPISAIWMMAADAFRKMKGSGSLMYGVNVWKNTFGYEWDFSQIEIQAMSSDCRIKNRGE